MSAYRSTADVESLAEIVARRSLARQSSGPDELLASAALRALAAERDALAEKLAETEHDKNNAIAHSNHNASLVQKRDETISTLKASHEAEMLKFGAHAIAQIYDKRVHHNVLVACLAAYTAQKETPNG